MMMNIFFALFVKADLEYDGDDNLQYARVVISFSHILITTPTTRLKK